MRYSKLKDAKAMSLEEVSRELGVTKERVRQIEHKALQKLRAKLERLGIPPESILPENYEEIKA